MMKPFYHCGSYQLLLRLLGHFKLQQIVQALGGRGRTGKGKSVRECCCVSIQIKDESFYTIRVWLQQSQVSLQLIPPLGHLKLQRRKGGKSVSYLIIYLFIGGLQPSQPQGFLLNPIVQKLNTKHAHFMNIKHNPKVSPFGTALVKNGK